MNYAVVYEKTGTGYSAYVPDLPGCITTGPNLDQTKRLINEAIEFHLAGLREDGLPIPKPTTRTFTQPTHRARYSVAAKRREPHAVTGKRG
jgi:predicted RNase H-like HicB family nuclease